LHFFELDERNSLQGNSSWWRTILTSRKKEFQKMNGKVVLKEETMRKIVCKAWYD